MKTNSDFLHKSSSWVEIGLHAENQLPGYPGSGLNKLFRVGGVGGQGGDHTFFFFINHLVRLK